MSEVIFIRSIDNKKIGVVERKSLDGTPKNVEYVILLESGQILNDGPHDLSDFEPVTIGANFVAPGEPDPLIPSVNYLSYKIKSQ